MIKEIYSDGTYTEFYEPGDIVEVIKKQYSSFVDTDIGEWGRVILYDKKDRDRGHSGAISHIGIQLAGYSSPKDAFFQRIASIPVWDVRLKK